MKKRRLPPPLDVLAALRGQPRLFAPQPVVPIEADVVWLPAGARSDVARVARKLARVVRAGSTGWMSAGELARMRASEMAAADIYVCHGAPTLGSGRSVFVGDHQIKGVGRTTLSSVDGLSHVVDGRLRCSAVLFELAYGGVAVTRLSEVLSPRFVLFLPGKSATDDAFLLGRLGSPLRLGHLLHLASASATTTSVGAMVGWRELLAKLRGIATLDERHIEGLFDDMLAASMKAVVASRLGGVYVCGFVDNADVFGREFDFEDLRVTFPIVTMGGGRLAIRPREHAVDFLARIDVNDPRRDRDTAWRSLKFLKYAVAATHVMAQGAGYDLGALRARQSRRGLERAYEAAWSEVLAERLGIRRSPAIAQAFAKSLPLFMPAEPPAFSWSHVADLLDDVPTNGEASSSERSLARGCRRTMNGRERATFTRHLRTTADGASIDDRVTSLLRRSEGISGSVSVRREAYRALFREASAL